MTDLFASVLGARRQAADVAVLMIAGAALRAAWAWLKPPTDRLGEAFNVAVSLAHGTGFSNALGSGTGPTAHLTPSMVLIAGAVYRVLGIHTPAAEAVLSGLAIAIVLAVFAIAFRLFGLFGVDRRWRLGALALLLLAPVFWTVEAIDFRLWEGGVATALSLLLLTRLTRRDARPVRIGDWIATSALAALLFVVSPTVGAGGGLACIVFLIRNARRPRWPLLGGLTLAILIAALAPWTIRNAIEMGRPIPLRDNAGLEMSIAYYPGAADGAMTGDRYWARVRAIHPYNSPAAFQAMRAAGGELPYYDGLKREVSGWIARHPGEAARLTARHLREFVLPDRWQFDMRSGHGIEALRYALVLSLCVLGYAGALTSFAWLPAARYAAVATLALPLAYMIVDPTPRYLWPNYALLAFWSASIASQVVRWRKPG